MKEATGELNMTVVTLVAVAAVAALFYFFLWPMIQKMVAIQTCSTYGNGWTAKYVKEISGATGTDAKVNEYMCCPKNSTGQAVEDNTKCISISNTRDNK